LNWRELKVEATPSASVEKGSLYLHTL